MAEKQDSSPSETVAARSDADAKAVEGDDAKAKFREALERKKQGQANRPGVLGATTGVGSAHGKVGGKREFRRKSS